MAITNLEQRRPFLFNDFIGVLAWVLKPLWQVLYKLFSCLFASHGHKWEKYLQWHWIYQLTWTNLSIKFSSGPTHLRFVPHCCAVPRAMDQVRSDMGECAGAARRCVHFPTVFQGPPSSHPPDLWLAHLHLLEMLINLMQPRCTWMAHWPPPLTRLPCWESLVSRISVRKTSHMSIKPQLTLTDYAGNKSHLSLSATARWT